MNHSSVARPLNEHLHYMWMRTEMLENVCVQSHLLESVCMDVIKDHFVLKQLMWPLRKNEALFFFNYTSWLERPLHEDVERLILFVYYAEDALEVLV